MQGISRIHPKYALLRGGPLRVGDVARRCALRPWIPQARYERSGGVTPSLTACSVYSRVRLTRRKIRSLSEPWANTTTHTGKRIMAVFPGHRRVRASRPRNSADVELRAKWLPNGHTVCSPSRDRTPGRPTQAGLRSLFVRFQWLEICALRQILLFFLLQILEHGFKVIIELRGVGLPGCTHLFHYFVLPLHCSSPISSSGVHRS